MKKLLSVALVSFFLASCGGGGGGGDSSTGTPLPVTTAAFPLASGYQNLLLSGRNFSFHGSFKAGGISGSVSGTVNQTGLVSGAVFEGVSAYVSTTSTSVTVSAGTTSQSSADSGDDYFDRNFLPLGSSATGDYEVISGTGGFPASAKIGDQGTYANFNAYTSSAKAVPLGTVLETWRLAADGSSTTTAQLILTAVSTDTSGASATDQHIFRVDGNGNMTEIGGTSTVPNPTVGSITITFTSP